MLQSQVQSQRPIPPTMNKKTVIHTIDLVAELRPETPLEHQLLQQLEVQEGMMWGVPRYGHPEGEVFRHVQDVYANIERIPQLSSEDREKLRLIALIHDTFKYQEDKARPRNWNRHHAVLARRFMEQFTDDTALLTIIQYHDEAYYIWRDKVMYKHPDRAEQRMNHLLDRLQGATQLYYLFFKCDTSTGDKNPAPIKWVEANLPGVQAIELK